MQAGPSLLRRLSRRKRGGQPGAKPPALPVLPDRIDPFAEADHQSIHAFIGQEHVGSESQGQHPDTGLEGEAQRPDNVLHRSGKKDRRRPANPVGGEAGQRRVLPDFAPHGLSQSRDEPVVPARSRALLGHELPG